VDELAGEYDGRVKFGKLNVDQNHQVTNQYGITGIPALLMFKNGQLVKKVVGVKPKKDLKAELDALL
jgi:thioredoxin 1